jgi:CDP-6-deoxy-D-xylo-4-hexulose-3-dehydrase
MVNGAGNTKRAEILSLIPEHFEEAFHKRKFVPGEMHIPVSGRVFDERDVASLVDASLDFWLTAGRFAGEFEEKFAKWVGAGYAHLVNSGSSANLLAIACLTSKTLGDRALKPGDEVITTAAGFPTTAGPIYQYGLTPVYVDIRLGTYNAALGEIEAAISPRTKAIFLAHTLGNPFDARNAAKFARDNSLWLIEDCCDALGSELDGKRAGTFGDISTFSFYPAHHITMGEGGAVLTDSPKLSELIRSFRDWGRDCRCETGHDDRCGMRFSQKFGELPHGYDHKYVYSEIGYNLKATDMQAAIGLSQLGKLDGFVARRRENFNYMSERLKDLGDRLLLPEAAPGSNPSWFGFPIGIRPEANIERVDLLRYLDSKKIGTRLLFGGNLTRQPAFLGRNHRVAADLRNTDYVTDNVFWVGVYPGLSDEMLNYAAACIREGINGRARQR